MLTCDPLGRATREEEDAKGPREEENHVHATIRERYDDRRQEEDEPEPDVIESGR